MKDGKAIIKQVGAFWVRSKEFFQVESKEHIDKTVEYTEEVNEVFKIIKRCSKDFICNCRGYGPIRECERRICGFLTASEGTFALITLFVRNSIFPL